MSRLSDTLQRALDELGHTSAHLERQADLPPMSIKNIFKGSHPRAERFDKLLGAISSLTLRVDLLIAYTLDDTPETYAHDLDHLLRSQLYELLRRREDITPLTLVREAAAIARPVSTATKARQILAAMLDRLNAGDLILADWLAETGELLTAPHLAVSADTPAAGSAAAQALADIHQQLGQAAQQPSKAG